MKITLRKSLIVALSLLGLGIWLYVFRFSLLPHRKPPVLKNVDIELIQPGQMLPVETDSLRYFVFRPVKGEPYVLAVPLFEGAFYLPEQYWFKPHTSCRDFALETANGIADDNSVFACRDNNLPPEWQKRWRWNAQGKHIGSTDAGKFDEMFQVNFKLSGSKLTFTRLAGS